MGNLAAHKTYIFLALGVFLAFAAGWWSLSDTGVESNSPLGTAGGTGITAPGGREIVDTLLQLRAVSLSGTILSDPAFLVLQDFGTQIVPEPVGRPNPFAPLGFGPRSTSTPTPQGAATTSTSTPVSPAGLPLPPQRP